MSTESTEEESNMESSSESELKSYHNMLEPSIESLVEKSGSKFVLASLAAKRANDLNAYWSQLGSGSRKSIPPQIRTYESKTSLSLAFEEIEADMVLPIEKTEEEIKAEEEAELLAAKALQAEEAQEEEEEEAEEGDEAEGGDKPEGESQE